MKRILAPALLMLLPAVAVMTFLAGTPVATRSHTDVRESYRSSEGRLLDRHGELIHALRVDDTRRRLEWVTLDRISPALLDAVVRAEDRRFRTHGGVDAIGIAGALRHNLFTAGARRGASTITMQLAAILDPALRADGGKRSLVQKWRQMQAARAIEGSWTKDQILETYLNLISFRGELQGIAAASRGLFNKDAGGLTQPESLILAVLIRAPNAASAVVARRACGLSQRMALNATSGCESIQALVHTAINVVPRLRSEVALAPHVARQLLRSVTTVERAGGSERTSQPGLEVVSTLDAGVQRFAAEALRHQLQQIRSGNVRDGAVLVADNATGEVLAYVGNAGNNPQASYVDGVQAPRQAGSTLKPFLYGMALEQRRLTAASLLHDAPVNLLTPSGVYVPQNYDRDFRGWVSVRTALAGSLNVPAVRALMLIGVDNFTDSLRRFGFSGLTESGDYYGYSLALGSAEVTLWQLVNAYRTLANGGRTSALTLLPRPLQGGEGGEEGVRNCDRVGCPHPEGEGIEKGAVLSKAVAFIVGDMLADRGARSVSFGLDNPIALPFWAAVKTGTSKDMRDNWCIGYSPRYTVGVWVGNFDGEAMHDVSGVTGAAPVWAEVMQFLHRGVTTTPPLPPADIASRTIRFEPAVEAARTEYFLPGTEMERVTLNPGSTRAPRIVYPGQSMIIALDPDIPADRQRMFFAAEPTDTSARWQLDGEISSTVDGWQPRSGEHALQLIGDDGEVLDTVRFTVRGRPL